MTAHATNPAAAATPAALAWWQELQADAGARAQLRRCHSGLEAATVLVTLRLARRLGVARDPSSERFARACELARVLAWIKENHRDPLMRIVGWSEFPSEKAGDAVRPMLSEARFRRLLRTDDATELADQFIRLLRQTNGTCSVQALARDFMNWLDPLRSESTKRRWAYDYFHAGAAAPTTPDFEDTDA